MARSPEYREIVIAGPTASGKTACAVAVAAARNGEILSADSRQVYRLLDIGTGKDLAEYRAQGRPIPFHLIDIADVTEKYTLYRYCNDFNEAIITVRARGALPVVCGGTGLYVEALLRGYKVSEVPEDEMLRNALMAEPMDDLLMKLAQYPNLYNRCDKSSRKRVVRALEIAQHRGDGETETRVPSVLKNPLVVIISPPAETLRVRIAARLDARLESGMIDEVRSLRESGVSDERLLMLGMEYAAILRYLNGSMGYPQMREHLYNEICRLAKRQRTWFRGMQRRGVACHWLESADHEAVLRLFDASQTGTG